MTMRTLPLTAHTIQFSVLAFLLDQADRGDAEFLRMLDPKDLDQLSHLSIRDLLRLTDQREPFLHVVIDRVQLHHGLRRLNQRDDGESEKLWFVQRGAPQVLMSELFGVELREFRDLRRMAGLPQRPGRPTRLEADVRQAVIACWRRMRGDTSLIDRYKTVSTHFPEIGIASLYAVLHDIS